MSGWGGEVENKETLTRLTSPKSQGWDGKYCVGFAAQVSESWAAASHSLTPLLRIFPSAKFSQAGKLDWA